jgi:hypothetical protein
LRAGGNKCSVDRGAATRVFSPAPEEEMFVLRSAMHNLRLSRGEKAESLAFDGMKQ